MQGDQHMLFKATPSFARAQTLDFRAITRILIP